jgi:hypothetical protein
MGKTLPPVAFGQPILSKEAKAVFTELFEAYRILREAYHHDMHREPPADNALQIRVRELLAKGRAEVIIIHGNVVDGLRFVGPFNSIEAADEYARLSTTLRDEPWTVAYLNPPLED